MSSIIKKINIKNFKGIESAEVELLGRDVYLTGANGAGKSSFIEAAWLGLTGKNLPPEPIKDGAKKGLIEIELSDGYVVRTKLAKNKIQTFEIENLNAENEKDAMIKAPRTWLNEKIGVIDFDIDAFFKMTDLKQVEYFCKITGLEVSHIDIEIEEISEGRKYDKKKLAELLPKAGFYVAADAEKPLVDVVLLSSEIRQLEDADREKITTYERGKEALRGKNERIGEIRRQMELLEGELSVLRIDTGNIQTWLDAPENLPVPNERLTELHTTFVNANEINRKITEAVERKQVDMDIDNLNKVVEKYNEDIEALRTEKARVISEKINIDGLTYDVKEGRFLFNGLPFDKDQINTASQIIAGLKIGASLLNEVKILKFDGSLIDKQNLEVIKAWAKENTIELFVELVDREAGPLKIQVDEQQ